MFIFLPYLHHIKIYSYYLQPYDLYLLIILPPGSETNFYDVKTVQYIFIIKYIYLNRSFLCKMKVFFVISLITLSLISSNVSNHNMINT